MLLSDSFKIIIINLLNIYLENQTATQETQKKNQIKHRLPIHQVQVIHQAPQTLAKQQILKEKTLFM